MKHLLVAIDFTHTADNACEMALAIASKAQAEVTLLHCFHIPVIASDGPVISVPFEELLKNSTDALNERKAKYAIEYPNVTIHVESQTGFAAEEIIDFIKEGEFDLVVLGISGSGDFDQLLGSTSVIVANKSKIPVLIVPPKAHQHLLKSIVLAFDLHGIEHTSEINFIIELSNLFQSKITGLTIRTKDNLSSAEQLALKQTSELLLNQNYELVNYADSDTLSGLENYSKEHEIDLLVMLKRKHGFFDSLFNGSMTRRMAFHTHVPLLILHD